MSRRGRGGRREALAPALFPFLAVMVCTIGALVFLLTIAVSQASRAAADAIAVADEEQWEQLAAGELITAELAARREAMGDSMRKARSVLTHLDEHILRLEDELQAAIEQARRLATREQSPADSDASAEIEQIQAQLASLRSAIDKNETPPPDRPAFCIIPYEGPHGTARRPIYLECTAKGIIIQPEGVLLTMEDLRPPHGPGNPLDASLRLIRSRFQTQDGSSGQAAAYPLLLVRPDGIAAYAAARSALGAWDDQQGYELIEADMPLAFPPGISGLTADLARVLERAKERQRQLIASLPQARAVADVWEATPVDLAESAGDRRPVELHSGDEFIPGAALAQWTREPPPGALGGPGVERLPDVPGGQSSAESFGGGVGGFQGTLHSLNAMPSGSAAVAAGPAGEAMAGNAASGGMDASGGAPGDGGTEGVGGSAAAGTSVATATAGRSADPSGALASGPTGQTNGTGGSANSFAASSPTSSAPLDPTSAAGLDAARAGREVPGSTNTSRSASRTSSLPPGRSGTQRAAIANSLGEGWVLSRSRLSATPVRRVVPIDVHAGQWIIYDSPSRGGIAAKIDLTRGPSDTAQALAATLREQVQSWDLAMSDGYWIPVVMLRIDGDAQWSAEQLTAMLEGSGVEIQR